MILLACCFGGSFFNAEKTASAAAPQYARVMTETAVLYRSQSGAEDVENKFFVLPKGYFVQLEDAADGTLYKVTYDGLSGYVRASDVDIVSFIPKTKYAAGQMLGIETPDGGNCNLREFAVKTSAKVTEGGIPDGTGNIVYYNYVIAGADKWYYVSYEGKTGYIFGDYAVITTAIAVNDGAAEPVTQGGGENDPQPLDTTTLLILIAVIGIPAVIIIIMLFKPLRRAPRIRSRGYDSRRVPMYYDPEDPRLPPPRQ